MAKSTCRSKGPKGEWIERTHDDFTASHSLKGDTSQMEVVEDFESRPQKAVSFVVERDLDDAGMEGAEGACLKHCLGEKGREEEDEEENSREKQVRNEITQGVVAGIKKKASAFENAKPT